MKWMRSETRMHFTKTDSFTLFCFCNSIHKRKSWAIQCGAACIQLNLLLFRSAHTARYHTMVHFNNWTIKILNSHKIRFSSFHQNKVIRIVSGIYVCVVFHCFKLTFMPCNRFKGGTVVMRPRVCSALHTAIVLTNKMGKTWRNNGMVPGNRFGNVSSEIGAMNVEWNANHIRISSRKRWIEELPKTGRISMN